MNKTLTKILAFVGGLVVLGGAVLGGLQLWGSDSLKPSNWNKDEQAEQKDPPIYEEELSLGGVVGTESENGGIEVLSAVLPRSAYALNGISEQADGALFITAKVLPDNATDKSLTWSWGFKNPESEWANGKNLEDYVTFTLDDEVLYLTCLQPFGEQIIVTATSQADETKFGRITVDYEQRAENLKISFGNVKAGEDGNIHVDFMAGESGGKGGAVSVSYGKSSVYTLASNFTRKITVVGNPQFKIHQSYNGNGWVDHYATYYAIESGKSTENLIGKDVYFDFRFFDTFDYSEASYYGEQGAGSFGTSIRERVKNSYYFEDITEFRYSTGAVFMTVCATVESAHSTVSKNCDLILDSWKIPVDSVNLGGNIVI